MESAWGARASEIAEGLGLPKVSCGTFSAAYWTGLVEWAHESPRSQRRSRHARWLARWRQDLSLEALSLLLFHVDQALREATWQLGLPAPDWHALLEVIRQYTASLLDELASLSQASHQQLLQRREEQAAMQRFLELMDAPGRPEDTLAVMVREVARVLRCEVCAILLPGPADPHMLQLAAIAAPTIIARAVAEMGFPLSDGGLVSQVFLTGAPATSLASDETQGIPDGALNGLESLGFAHLMVHPLTFQGRAQGVLCLANRFDDLSWQPGEQNWLSAVSSQLAMWLRLVRQELLLRDEEREAGAWAERLLGLADPALVQHGEAVSRLASAIGQQLGLSPSRLRALELAGRLHDIGLVFLPETLRRRPGPLWPEERQLVERHPLRGAELLRGIPALAEVVPLILQHHERWDGQGYPDGRRGDDVPLEARILALAEAYVSLTVPQVYRAPMGAVEAMSEVRSLAGSAYDPLVVQALESLTEQGLPALEGAASSAPGTRAREDLSLLGYAGRLTEGIQSLTSHVTEHGANLSFWRAVEELCGHDAAMLWVRDAEGRLRLLETHGALRLSPGATASADSLEAQALVRRIPLGTGDPHQENRFAIPTWVVEGGYRSLVAFPLLVGERAWGVMTLLKRTHAPFSGPEFMLAELAASCAAWGLYQRLHRGRPLPEKGVRA
ncbi:MAG: HD domain-containing phosphohydrolase [Candidatus Sericytochromatia bacterium]|nr:HD domain-containing phosphohydrolase [Candidatus Sericytochromatia bacterium]